MGPVKRVLTDAKVSKSEIDEVVLVGACTRMPKVQSIIQQFFDGKKVHMAPNPDQTVARGATLYAANLVTQEPSVKGDTSTLTNLLLEKSPSALPDIQSSKFMAEVPQGQQHQSGLYLEPNLTAWTDEILRAFSKTLKDVETLIEQALQVQHHTFEGLLRREIDALPELLLDKLVSEHNKGIHGKFQVSCMVDADNFKEDNFPCSLPEETASPDCPKLPCVAIEASKDDSINSRDNPGGSPRHLPPIIEVEDLPIIDDDEREVLQMFKGFTDFKKLLTFEQFVESPIFGLISSLAIISNAGYIGYEADHRVQSEIAMLHGEDHEALSTTPEISFTIFFVVELLMRMMAQKKDWLFGKDVYWNLFDFFLILISLFQMFSSSSGGSLTVFRIFRIFRLVRLLKVMRKVSWLQSLNLMAVGILKSLTPLLWALLLLILIMYALAVFFVSVSATYLSGLDPVKVGVDEDVTQVVNGLDVNFGSMYKSLCVLFEAATGGNDWAVFAREMRMIGELYYVAFALYVVFVTLGVLNILAAFFVDGTAQASSETKHQLMQQNEAKRAEIAELIRGVCHQSDSDHSGTITEGEFDLRQEWFNLLDLEPADTRTLFMMLDMKGDGEVSIDDFVNGCVSIMKPPRSIDLCACLHLVKKSFIVLEKVLTSVKKTHEEVTNLKFLNRN